MSSSRKQSEQTINCFDVQFPKLYPHLLLTGKQKTIHLCLQLALCFDTGFSLYKD